MLVKLTSGMFKLFFRYLFSRDISSIYTPEDLFALEQVFRTFQIDFENFSELTDGTTANSDVGENVQDFDVPQVRIFSSYLFLVIYKRRHFCLFKLHNSNMLSSSS
jgi:hypothetical protein